MLVAALTVPLAVVGAGPPAASGHPADKPTDSIHEIPELIGITKPAKTASLGPVNAQTLATLHVTEGTTVQSGEPLFSFDDTTQRVRVATARAEAESTLDVELAKAQWEKAKLEYEWFLSLDTGNNASSKELNDSRADMEIARLEFELAKFELAQSQRAYEREKIALDQLHLAAPFSGYVSEIMHESGEAVDQQESVLTLVQLDPLHITVDCPVTAAHLLRDGQRVEVQPIHVPWKPRSGHILMRQHVANAASQTFRIKVAVDNPDLLWMAGVKVRVTPIDERESVTSADHDSSRRAENKDTHEHP